MAIILKEESANSVSTPSPGKTALFVDDNGTMSTKNELGNVTTFPTVDSSNTQVVYTDGTALAGTAALTFDNTSNTLTVSGNLDAGGVKTDNLYYANGNPWDLQEAAGSNNQIQYNLNNDFAASANFTYNDSTQLLTLSGNAQFDNANLGNVATANFISGTLTTSSQPNITSIGSLVDLTVTGNAVVGGNLTVNGNVTYVNVDTLQVEDPVIGLGGGPNGAPLTSNDGKDRGLLLHYYTTEAVDAFMGWDNGNGEFALGSNVSISSDVVTFNSFGNLRVNGLFSSNANLGNTATANFFTGTLTTNAQPNITSVGKLVSLLTGSTANAADFPNAIAISSQDNTGITGTENVGLVGEGVGNGVEGIGLLGLARANGAQKATGVQGTATVTNTADVGAAVGVRGYSVSTHSGGYNIGVLGNALGSGVGNYAFYVQNGGIASIENDTFWDLNDDSTTALAFNSSGKANILAISTDDGNEGVLMSGTLEVTGNITATAGLKTDNLYYANGNPWDLQEAAGSNTQIQFNISNNFAASANLTFDDSTQLFTVLGNGAFTNVNAGNLLTANFVSGTLTTASQPNITSVGTLTSLDVTGNVAANNVNATSSVTAGNIYANSGTVGASLLTGTLTTASQPNITSVGILSSLDISGNATAGNVYANSGTIGASLLTGTLTTAAQPNITSVGTLSSLTVTGNASAGNLSTAGILSVTGNATVGNLSATDVSGTTLGGTLTTAAQPNVTSVGTLSGLAVNGNITAANITANTGVFTGNGSGLTNLAGANVTGTVANATHASTANTVVDAAQPNITSVGTLTSLAVTGNASAGNISTAGALSVTGNANVGNIGGTGAIFTTLSGDLTTAAQPNITSVGTLSSLSVTGNANVGNIGATNAVFTGTGSFGGNVAMGNFHITGLAEPVNPNDAATKQYVDSVAEGLHTHDSCNAATTGTLATLSSGTVTYNNGTDGVGATLTTTGSYTTIDGVTLSDGMRILVKDESNAAHNGIYVRTSSTVLTRATDFDTPAEMAGGDFTFVTSGTLYDSTGWVMSDPVTTVGTSAVNWTQFSGAGTYTAGTGLTLTGSVFSVNSSQTQVTQVGTLTGLNVNGTVTASAFTANTGVFTGNGSGLSAIAGGNVTGQVGNALVAGTVYTAAQPNITSVGTLTSLAVTGNASAGNISTGGALSVTGNANVGNIGAAAGVFTSVSGNGSALTALNASNVSTGTLAQARLANASVTLGSTTLTLGDTVTTVAGLSSVTSTTFVGALTGAATTAGTVTTAAQPNITSVGTLSSLAVTGNASAGNISTGGALSVTGNANVGNIGAAAGVFTSVSGNGSALTALNGSNITTGTVAAARVATLNQNTTGYAATVSSAAQPNITSVGTLTSLAVTGNVSGGNLTSTGTVGGTGATHLGNVLTTGANTTAGTVTGNWTLSAGSRWNATYADLAEKYVADAHYEPGTVLVFGGDHEVTAANEFDSTRVAGVVSTDPAYVMNAGCEGEHVAILALQGRVPVKVSGQVQKGDLMVSGGNGHAIANNFARAGTIIGKALENFVGESGVIEVVVGRF